MKPQAATLSISALLLTLGACDSATELQPPRVLAVEPGTSALPAQPLHITLDRSRPLAVEYRTAGEAPQRIESAAALEHDLVLTRLLPGRTYDYTIVGTGYTGTFDVAALPEALAAVELEATGSLGVPLVMLHLFSEDGYRGYAAVDGRGRVVWYWPTEHLPFGMARRENGSFVLLDRDRGLLEVTPAGEVLHEVSQKPAGRQMHHDVIASTANTILFIAYDPREVDGVEVLGEAVWEWVPETGALEKRWSSWDHLSIDADRGPRSGDEWMHSNSLAVALDGSILMSVRFLDQVLSLAPDWSEIRWRLGGVNATVEVDPDGVFSGQHTAAEVAPGRILVFDNGTGRGGPSRALELEIRGDSAFEAWSWAPPNGNFATAVGSARRLENGNTLVAFGMSEGLAGSTGPIEVYEVTPAGGVAWHLVVRGARVMYRAEPLESVGGEEVVGGG